jgi:serine/threonine-protein kinase
MVHRDVKPANILLDRQSNAHLTDFGFAKVSEASLLTLPGQALGSMDYMAPEQIRGETVTAATDVYALGCVIFQCIEGRPPFSDRVGVRVLYAHLTDDPPELSDRGDLPPGFAEAVMAALRKDPADRPQGATEYAHMLSQAAGPTA